MVAGEECPTLRPTREQFSKPFADYIEAAFKKYPGVAMVKVVPPRGWRPRSRPFPALATVPIETPIKQHCFGTRGAYRCYLVEQKGLNAAEFRDAAATRDVEAPHRRPARGTAAASPSTAFTASGPGEDGEAGRDTAHVERAFWSAITLNPPLYGADTPASFFDTRVPWGWNLRDLGDMLKRPDVRPFTLFSLAIACRRRRGGRTARSPPHRPFPLATHVRKPFHIPLLTFLHPLRRPQTPKPSQILLKNPQTTGAPHTGRHDAHDLLRHVALLLLLARGGRGPDVHQLPALWRAQGARPPERV